MQLDSVINWLCCLSMFQDETFQRSRKSHIAVTKMQNYSKYLWTLCVRFSVNHHREAIVAILVSRLFSLPRPPSPGGRGREKSLETRMDRGQLNSFSFLRGYQDDMALSGRLVKSDAVFLAYIANLVVEAIINYLKLCRREKQTKAILSMVGSGVDTVIRCWAERSFTSTETPSSTRWSVMQVQSSSVSTSQVGESNGAHRKALVQRNLWMTSLMSRKAAVEVCNVTHVRNLDIHSFERIIDFPCHCVKLNGARWDTIFVSWRLE